MDCIPFFIAILLLIILINVNTKEGFSDNVTSDLIKSNEEKLITNLKNFKTYYLIDLNKNIQARLNHNYNLQQFSNNTNDYDFGKYINNYRTSDPSFVIINELEISINHKNIYTSSSYNSLQSALISCQNIINIVGSQIIEETSLPDDINEYKILLICIKILDDINEQYNKFNYIFNSSNSFTDISGLELLESHDLIIQVIKKIDDQLPLLFTLCIPYLNDKTLNINLSTIKIKDITNFGPIIDMLKSNNDNYDNYTNFLSNTFNDLIVVDTNKPIYDNNYRIAQTLSYPISLSSELNDSFNPFEVKSIISNESINQSNNNQNVGNQFNNDNVGNQFNNDNVGNQFNNDNVGNQFNNLGNNSVN